MFGGCKSCAKKTTTRKRVKQRVKELRQLYRNSPIMQKRLDEQFPDAV